MQCVVDIMFNIDWEQPGRHMFYLQWSIQEEHTHPTHIHTTFGEPYFLILPRTLFIFSSAKNAHHSSKMKQAETRQKRWRAETLGGKPAIEWLLEGCKFNLLFSKCPVSEHFSVAKAPMEKQGCRQRQAMSTLTTFLHSPSYQLSLSASGSHFWFLCHPGKLCIV